MALTVNSSIVGSVSGPTAAPGGRRDGPSQPFSIASSSSGFSLSPRPQSTSPLSLSSRTSHVLGASNRFSSRSGRLQKKDRRPTTVTEDKLERENQTIKDSVAVADDGFVMPDLPGREPDFWEGSKWDGLGFFVQYMWAFGILFALVACGIAVATYNEGATDFKDTPVYKESVQSRELLEGPEASGLDVFESNPTEEAPSLE